MKRTEEVELTNMCMIIDKNNRVIVQNRKKSWTGLAFPGGHVEAKESVVDSTIREIKEETGLDISNLKMCGIKQWLGKDNLRKIVFLFKTYDFSGELTSNDEGENFWIDYQELLKRKDEFAKNFAPMLEVFNNDNISEHYLTIINDEYHDTLK